MKKQKHESLYDMDASGEFEGAAALLKAIVIVSALGCLTVAWVW